MEFSLISETSHCVKSVQIRSFFWSVFSRIRTECGEIQSVFSYSVWIRENSDQKKNPYLDIFHVVSLSKVLWVNIPCHSKFLVALLPFTSNIWCTVYTLKTNETKAGHILSTYPEFMLATNLRKKQWPSVLKWNGLWLFFLEKPRAVDNIPSLSWDWHLGIKCFCDWMASGNSW